MSPQKPLTEQIMTEPRTDSTDWPARYKALEAELATERTKSQWWKLQAQQTKDAQHQQLSCIIEASPIPAFAIDKQHTVTHWNKACEQITGISAKSVLGTKRQWSAFYIEPRPVMADLVLDGQIERMVQFYPGKFRPSGVLIGAWEAEDYFANFDRWLHFTAAHIRDESDQVIGAIETLQDITERKKAECALIEAKQLAEASTNAKTAFLANMSHEIRTPMNAILGLTQLVLDGELTRKQRDYLAKVQTSSRALLGILNDVLDYSKIEAGHLELEQVDFNLEELLSQVSDLYAARVEEKNLEVFLEIAPEAPRWLRGDPLRLSQILNNLVGNAVKFTQSGEIHIRVELFDLDGSDGRPPDPRAIGLKCSVRDTGIGISPEQQAALFRPFAQADGSITRKFGGTGLGLTICRHLVEFMGGSIDMQSSLGAGSTFSFKVVLQKTETDPQHMDLLRLKGMRVLVVDDQETSREVLKGYLESWNFEVLTADSGESALAQMEASRIQGHPVDMILMDWKMPGMDGVEAAKAIEQQSANGANDKPPTVIMVTGFSREVFAAEASKAHFDAVLHKPVVPSTLFDVIAKIQQPDFQTIHSSLNQVTRIPDLYALAEAVWGSHILLVEDNAINQEIAQEFLLRTGFRVRIANHGQEALDLLQAQSFDAVLMDLHMPVMDGFEATRLIRKKHSAKELPILALTAAAMVQDRQASLDVGMNDHIPKPIDPELLIEKLMQWIPHRARKSPLGSSNTEAADSAAAVSPTTLPALDGFNLDGALRRLGGNATLLTKLLRQFATDFAQAPNAAKQLLLAGDGAAAKKEIHRVKGVAANLGAEQLAQALAHVEANLSDDKTWQHAQSLLSRACTNILEQLPPSPPSSISNAAAEPVNVGALLTQTNKFRLQLQEYEVLPSKELAQWLDQLANCLPQSKLLKFAQQVEKFDFAQAMLTLDAIEQDIKGAQVAVS
jgi:two-component system, sensor histidine kinase and response regulator